MVYRKLGKTNCEVSILGMGCMRFPTKNNNIASSDIMDDEAIKIIKNSINKGINYFDTAYTYHSGRSETILGKSLNKNIRKNIMITTKIPVWKINNCDQFDIIISEQLKRLKTDYIDFYLFHALNSNLWKKVKNFGLLEKIISAKEKGMIRYYGFSFHDDFEVFKEIIEYFPWDICQIQYNYMNTDYQAGKKGLDLAKSKNIGVIVMEPLLGGRLANPPEEIKTLIQSTAKCTPAKLAFDWMWQQNSISCVLSGMNSIEQVNENSMYTNKFTEYLGTSLLDILIEDIKKEYKKRDIINCSFCNYCQPCTMHINIPQVIKIYNEAIIYNDNESINYKLNEILRNNNNVKTCTGCRLCESKCPQNIPISSIMSIINM